MLLGLKAHLTPNNSERTRDHISDDSRSRKNDMTHFTLHRNKVKRILMILMIFSSSFTQIVAQASEDGRIVPFSSNLPVCASKCGPLYDVQGKCIPPNTAAVDNSCFCLDVRLEPFRSGTSGVSTVCGAASCTAEADLQSIRQWYSTFCIAAISATKTVPVLPGNSSNSQSWIAGHAKWVVMLVIIFTLIIGAWICACIFRKRYLNKKEKQFEMADPIAWGPHQLQGATGGYSENISSSSEKSRSLSKPVSDAAVGRPVTPSGSRTSKIES